MPTFRRPCHAIRIAAALLASVTGADAHLVLEGAGEVVNGALHPFISPGQVMVLLGLGILLGRRVPFEMGMPAKIILPVSAASLLATLTGWGGELPAAILVVIAMGIASLVLLDRRWNPWIYGLACAVGVAAVGLDSGTDPGQLLSCLKTLSGTWISICAVVFYIAACASHAEGKRWAVTGVRIVSAWILAIGMMMLAFLVKKGG